MPGIFPHICTDSPRRRRKSDLALAARSACRTGDVMLEARGISKRYPGTDAQALSDVSLSIRSGEILCIAGENGAGKTTLMKIIDGMEQPDSGTIFMNGIPLSLKSPADASRLGIGMVHQHFMLINEFTVAQNVTMGVERRTCGLFIDKKPDIKSIEDEIREYGFSLKPEYVVDSLTVSQMQQTEILKVLHRNANIIILDEPTSVLAESEIDNLFQTLRHLAGTGKTIIVITHKLGEIKRISDRVAVLSKGRLKGIFPTSVISEDEMASLMFGNPVPMQMPRINAGSLSACEPVLQACGITVRKARQSKPLLENASFTAHAGEILGLGGASGNGLGIIEGVLGGFIKISSGSLYLDRNDISGFDVKKMRETRLAYVPAKRITMGSCPTASVQENIASTHLDALSRGPLINHGRMKAMAESKIREFRIAARAGDKASSLSGGNIQKMILAREMMAPGSCIVFSQPAWGLDRESSRFVYEHMRKLRDDGKAVVLISYSLDELLGIADRIVIISSGRVAGEFINDGRLSRSRIGEMMLGKTGERGLTKEAQR